MTRQKIIKNNGWRSVTLLFDGDDAYQEVNIIREAARIRAEWTEQTRLERLSGHVAHEKIYDPLVRSVPQIGPRESGEAADRRYHGSGLSNGEW